MRVSVLLLLLVVAIGIVTVVLAWLLVSRRSMPGIRARARTPTGGRTSAMAVTRLDRVILVPSVRPSHNWK